MRISGWSSDVCSSDLPRPPCQRVCRRALRRVRRAHQRSISEEAAGAWTADGGPSSLVGWVLKKKQRAKAGRGPRESAPVQLEKRRERSPFRRSTYPTIRSEEHTSAPRSLMSISHAVYCLNNNTDITHTTPI